MKTSLVIGLGFGDEGKGRTVSYLASLNPNALVVRFQGGHQAGHTVVYKGVRHVFSSFGSGTLQGVPTLWSRNCTFYPTAVVNEYNVLKTKAQPQLYVDPLCPVTTPYDVEENQRNDALKQHGTVGVGFGTTIKRHENYFKLYFQDLFYESVLNAKLDAIERYYQLDSRSCEMERKQFLRDVDFICSCDWLKPSDELDVNTFEHVIFEGAQGILLDMDFGFFPHVTRSNTTSKKALELIKELGLPKPEIYYVTRAYQTRHGNGFMTNENRPLKLINNQDETNKSAGYQGKFRTGMIDCDLLDYALRCDLNFTKGLTKHMVITCIDQIEDTSIFDTEELQLTKEFASILISRGAETSEIKKEWEE
jgi:adenylosuccinate synthase